MRNRILPILLAAVVSGDSLLATPSLGLQVGITSEKDEAGGFPLVQNAQAAPIFVDAADYVGVIRAASDLQGDIERVSGVKPELVTGRPPTGKVAIIAGTLGKSPMIDELAKTGKIDVSSIAGKWESFLIAVVSKPLNGIDQALVVVGSDKRGTIYGLYEISEQIGVSPWYWWADVPPQKNENLFIKAGTYVEGPPVVKYRGIFINDENPCLSGWANEKFGGCNSKMYAHVFELLLRLRANYLWPAMWGKAFNEDDPINPRMADDYGIVMGTSHHEPMMRAQREWTKRKDTGEYGNGEWNYATNEAGLKKFWEEGIKRNKDFDNLVTIGMRGDGDEPMIEGGDMASNSKLLERIVEDQRKIISENINPDPKKVPQVWALYKEVQEYYEHGMRVPDDVTLLWCDDNWGNIRRLPTEEERKRGGGAGVYYHFDYVGGPRSYKWINTNPLPKIWEQMNLAHCYGANQLWIVNVGDLKPMELPMEFFLRMAWDPKLLSKEDIDPWTRRWAEREFGGGHGARVAEIVSKYAKYNGWRKPELLEPDTFSLTHYREAERVSQAWSDLVDQAEELGEALPEDKQDAFFQLVLYPVKACATVANMYIASGRNQLYARQGRASANAEAAQVRELFQKDQELSDHYNKVIAGGKWNHMMDQVRIGYTSWKDPKENILPEVTEISLPDTASFGVAVEGSSDVWPDSTAEAGLPEFDSLNRQRSYVEVFARGTRAIDFKASADQPWIVLTEDRAPGAGNDRRVWIDIDWSKAPEGRSGGIITVASESGSVPVQISAIKASQKEARQAQGAFGGISGPISFLAEDAAQNVPVDNVRWERIPDYGRGPSGMSVFPVTATSILPPNPAPRLEYPVFLSKSGRLTVDIIVGPTLNFVPERGLRLAVSFDDQPPQVLECGAVPENNEWETSVKNNARVIKSSHDMLEPGKHTLKVWMVDPGVVLQKIIVYSDPLPRSYFGPPETKAHSAAP